MKQEYRNKIKLAKKCLKYDPSLSDEEMDKNVDIGYKLVEELSCTKNIEVLYELLDFFTEENDEWGGFSEHLESRIQYNYTSDKILVVFYKKFDDFMVNNPTRCAMICLRFLGEDFKKFRKFFSNYKSIHSQKLIDIMRDWWFKYWPQEKIDMVLLLEEDIKKWKE